MIDSLRWKLLAWDKQIKNISRRRQNFLPALNSMVYKNKMKVHFFVLFFLPWFTSLFFFFFSSFFVIVIFYALFCSLLLGCEIISCVVKDGALVCESTFGIFVFCLLATPHTLWICCTTSYFTFGFLVILSLFIVLVFCK